MSKLEKKSSPSQSARALYVEGEFWKRRQDFCAGQAPRKIAHIMRLLESDDFRSFCRQSSVLRIVDIGCGAGKVSTGIAGELRELFPELRIEIDGYDLSPQAIEVARRDNEEGQWHCADFSVENKQWDLAVLCDIIEHVEEPVQFLEDVARKSRFIVVFKFRTFCSSFAS